MFVIVKIKKTKNYKVCIVYTITCMCMCVCGGGGGGGQVWTIDWYYHAEEKIGLYIVCLENSHPPKKINRSRTSQKRNQKNSPIFQG